MPYARPTKLAHVVYRTRRFEEMLRWYETVFGASIQYQNPALAFLTFDDEHHRFALVNMSVFQPDGAGADRQGAIGVDHLGYTNASLRDLLENYSLLKEKGITPYWCVHHGITASLYYADPDGNQMEFQEDLRVRCGHYRSNGLRCQHGGYPGRQGVRITPRTPGPRRDSWISLARTGRTEAEAFPLPLRTYLSP